MTKRIGMAYDAPTAYHRLIGPRYARIAQALVERVPLRSDDDVLELGAGTGIVTKLVAPRVRSLVATDLSAGMLDVARAATRRTRGVSFALVDYGKPLPFLDRSFDLVLSGLTYAQDQNDALKEVRRVLKPRGRFAFSMWGRSYHELTLLSDALEAIGRPRIPPPAAATAIRRLKRLGFTAVQREDVELTNRFATVDDYIAYRRGFGVPIGASHSLYERLIESVRAQAERYVDDRGRFQLGWTITIVSGRAP